MGQERGGAHLALELDLLVVAEGLIPLCQARLASKERGRISTREAQFLPLWQLPTGYALPILYQNVGQHLGETCRSCAFP